MANQQLSVWWVKRGNFVLQFLDGKKIKYHSVASVLHNCNEDVLKKMNEIGIPPSCYTNQSAALFRILHKRYGDPNQTATEDAQVTSWEFIEETFKVSVTRDDGEVEMYDPKDISTSEDLNFLNQLSKIPIINNSGSKFAEKLQNAVVSQVELWVESESDEEIPDGSLGFSSDEETNFDP